MAVDRNDFVLDDDLELVDAADDFTEGDSTQTDAHIICLLQKGELRYAPWLGYGIRKRLKAVKNDNKNTRELKVELENDGFVNPEVDLANGFENLKIYV
jgi:hypothetical protein